LRETTDNRAIILVDGDKIKDYNMDVAKQKLQFLRGKLDKYPVFQEVEVRIWGACFMERWFCCGRCGKSS
jgi:hypothetical protein